MAFSSSSSAYSKKMSYAYTYVFGLFVIMAINKLLSKRMCLSASRAIESRRFSDVVKPFDEATVGFPVYMFDGI